MPLRPGTRLGPYEIVAPLGAGGMGEVYRARDTRLGRDVAVKVLPQHLSANPELRARFEREARAIGSLNHPHICTLHDVGREGVTDYLVMELVEGETLSTRLAKGPLPLADVLRIGGQVADALERAHRAGVTHRDLKPGNVMLTKTGAKLMDFGLARGTGLGPSSDLTSSPTMTSPLTAEGTIIGTFQYMAPEQLEGQEADARADLWALGCLLHEMATGKRAFEGKSQASLITAIMGSEPAPVSQLSPLAPAALDRLVGACLAKDPAERIQSAHDVKLQLSWIAAGGSQTGAAAVTGVTARSRGTPGRAALAVGAVALVLGATAGYFGGKQTSSSMAGAGEIRYKAVTFEEGFVFAARFAPDERTIVYSADWDRKPRDLFVTGLDSPDFRPLGFTGSDLLAVSRTGDLGTLAGSKIVGGSPYSRRGTLALASLTGGASRPQLEGVRYADYGPDGSMAVVRDVGRQQTLEYPAGHVIRKVNIWREAGSLGIVNPRVSPSGEYVAYFDLSNRNALTVKIVNRTGKVVATGPTFGDWWGLAWTPSNEVWCAVEDTIGNQTPIYSLDVRGRSRLVYRAPGYLTLHDISRHGDVLASFDHDIGHAELVDATNAPPVDRSWRDGAEVEAFSADHTMLSRLRGGSGGVNGSIFLWRPGVDQPIRISEGNEAALSADASKALVVSTATPPTVTIVPTGAGIPQPLDLGKIESVVWKGWHPDGRPLLSLVRPGIAPVVHAFTPAGRDPVAILPPELQLNGANQISPDGSRVVATDSTGHLVLSSFATRAYHPLPGVSSTDRVIGWAADGASAFVISTQPGAMQVDRVNVLTGTRTPWKSVHTNHAAVTGLSRIIASPDGHLAYSYRNTRSELYVIHGLK